MEEKILVECDYKISKRCKQKYYTSRRNKERTLKRNNGKMICLHCSRKLKSSGRNNSNAKYLNIDDNFFKKIDSREKAYLLGWIASDGSISKTGFNIAINKKDIETLKKIKNIISKEVPLKRKKHNLIGFTINSREISKDLVEIFKLKEYKKSRDVILPEIEDIYFYDLIRGWFDGDGTIRKPTISRTLACSIASISKKFKEELKNKINIPCKITDEGIYFSGNNALDFLGKIYEGAEIFLLRKEESYRYWAEYEENNFLYGKKIKENNNLIFKWKKELKEAVAPFKNLVSDSGYDLTLVKKDKQIGNVELYDTGIKVMPEFGYYFDLVPRSSIIKSGYILANSVGIIDRTYTGTIKVPLIKIDKKAKELELPIKIVQIIPRKIKHIRFTEVEILDKTTRGDGGFGSTGK